MTHAKLMANHVVTACKAAADDLRQGLPGDVRRRNETALARIDAVGRLAAAARHYLGDAATIDVSVEDFQLFGQWYAPNDQPVADERVDAPDDGAWEPASSEDQDDGGGAIVATSLGIALVLLAAASTVAGVAGLTLLDMAFGPPARRQLLDRATLLRLAFVAFAVAVLTLFKACVLFREAGMVAQADSPATGGTAPAWDPRRAALGGRMGNSMVSIGLGAGGVSLFAFSMIAGTGGLMLLDVAFVPRGWPARVGRLVLAAVALTLAVVALYEARVLLQRAGFVAQAVGGRMLGGTAPA